MTDCEKLIKSYEDAIDCLKKNKPTSGFYMLQESVDMAIKALEEIQQYHAIGTVEECRAAVEKQIPFKPRTTRLIIGIGRCKCGAEFLNDGTNYCGNCSQKSDWGDEE